MRKKDLRMFGLSKIVRFFSVVAYLMRRSNMGLRAMGLDSEWRRGIACGLI